MTPRTGAIDRRATGESAAPTHPSHETWYRGVCQRCWCRRDLSQAQMPCPPTRAARPALVLAGSGPLRSALIEIHTVPVSRPELA